MAYAVLAGRFVVGRTFTQSLQPLPCCIVLRFHLPLVHLPLVSPRQESKKKWRGGPGWGVNGGGRVLAAKMSPPLRGNSTRNLVTLQNQAESCVRFSVFQYKND